MGKLELDMMGSHQMSERQVLDAIAAEAIGLLLDPDRMHQMRTDLAEVVGQLGTPGGATRTAQMVLELEGTIRE